MTRIRMLRLAGTVITIVVLSAILTGCFFAKNDPTIDRFGNPFEANKNVVLTPEEIYQKAHDATMTVQITEGSTVRQGTGFFIAADGTFITNYHVAESYIKYMEGHELDATPVQLKAKAYSGEVYTEFNILSYSKEKDLAVLQTVGMQDVKYLKLKRNGYLKGDNVYVLGAPGGREKTFLSGKIVNNEQKLQDIYCIQISAVLEHGISGSPVMSESGAVIGIATFALETKYNESFYAVHVTELEGLVRVPLYYNGDPALDS